MKDTSTIDERSNSITFPKEYMKKRQSSLWSQNGYIGYIDMNHLLEFPDVG